MKPADLSKGMVGYLAGKPAQSAFTLVEMMVALGLFSLVMIGILGCHFTGLQFLEFVRPKVQNAQIVRETLGSLIEEVRAANSIAVGTGTVSTFTTVPSGSAQIGNAIRIYPTTTNTPYVYYFQDKSSGKLYRAGLNTSNLVAIATGVTNAAPFTLEDFKGTVFTNNQNSAALGVLIQMRQVSGWKGMSDTYQVRTRITRRNIL
jgi:prepilin-type N-terminal cleavage/methylation domain-containing protein